VKGRPRDPTRVRRRTGHRRKPDEAPALRAVPAAIEVRSAIVPPEDLPKAMRPTWDRVVEILGTVGGAREADVFAIEALVRQYERMKAAGAVVDKYGIVARNAADEVIPSRFAREEREATAMFLRLAEHFGLSVASRMRLGLMNLQGKTMAQALHEDLEEG